MSEYFIWNTTERKFVAPAGSEKSFTTKRERARRFKSLYEAEANCCGNERPVPTGGMTNAGA